MTTGAGGDAVDIYTLLPIATPTEEHILPRALGGRLYKVGLIDKRTNDEFGDGIDARLDEALRSIRVVIDARNTDGKPPRALTSVEGDDGKKYRVEAGGVMIPAPEITATKLPTGETLIQGTIPNDDVLRNMLRKHARRTGKDLDELVEVFTATATHRVTAPPALRFGIGLWDDGPYRATAKIACNLLAFAAPGLFHDSAFTGIREYILKGTRQSVHPVQAVDVLLTDGIGPLDHLVRIDVSHSGEVSALVVYFGHLAFVVHLGLMSPGEPFSIAYRVDQLAGADRFNNPEDLTVAIPGFAEAAKLPHEAFAEMAIRQVGKLVPIAEKIQRELWLDRILAEPFQRFFAEVGDGEQTEEQKQALFGAIIMRIVEELAPVIAQQSQRQRDALRAERTERNSVRLIPDAR